jgi:hypothetical protein
VVIVRTPLVIGACVLAAVTGAGIGHALMPRDLATSPVKAALTPCPTEDSPGPCHWDAQTQGNGQGTSFDAPYCTVDRHLPEHLTVAGPAGGTITVDGQRQGVLVLVEGDYAEEVGPDAEPYDGILYNVPGPGTVAVDGKECAS